MFCFVFYVLVFFFTFSLLAHATDSVNGNERAYRKLRGMPQGASAMVNRKKNVLLSGGQRDLLLDAIVVLLTPRHRLQSIRFDGWRRVQKMAALDCFCFVLFFFE